jgi:drug/metabolite transporter (DMT)-like permease
MVLGWALAGEQVSARMLAAVAVTVVGIALVLIPGAPVAAVAAGTLYGADRPDAVGRPARAAQSERRAMIGSTRVARRAGR